MIFGGTIFKSALGMDSIVPHQIIGHQALSQFIGYLRDKHSRVVPSKEANKLICPSWFDTTRRKEEVKASSGLWLDQDWKDGHMSLEELTDVLPRVQFVAFNTFSSTKDAPKYRLYIPTQRLMTVCEYETAIKGVLLRISRKKRCHGFDLKPTHAASLFYLPCQAKSGYSFFEEKHGALLNVDEELQGHQEATRWETYYSNRPNFFPSKEAKIDDVEDALIAIPSDDREIWFSVACALKHTLGEAGFTVWDNWARKTTSNNYDERDQRTVWKSIKGCKRSKTIATVFKLAKEYRKHL